MIAARAGGAEVGAPGSVTVSLSLTPPFSTTAVPPQIRQLPRRGSGRGASPPAAAGLINEGLRVWGVADRPAPKQQPWVTIQQRDVQSLRRGARQGRRPAVLRHALRPALAAAVACHRHLGGRLPLSYPRLRRRGQLSRCRFLFLPVPGASADHAG